MSSLAISNQPSSIFNEHVYKECKHTWDYLGKVITLSRSLINVANQTPRFLLLVTKDTSIFIGKIAARTKLFSIVGASFALISLKKMPETILENVKERNHINIALDIMSITIMSADLFDSLTTFVNATLATMSVPVVFFETTGTPIGLLISGLGTVSRTIHLVKKLNLYKECAQKEEESIDGQHEKHKLQKGIKLDALALMANLVSMSAFVLLTVGTGGVAPTLLLATSTVIRLSSVAYDDYSKQPA